MNEEKKSKERIGVYTYYVKVPQTEHIKIQMWDNDCKVNFKDDRMAKMLHDHHFYYNFSDRLMSIEKKLDAIINVLIPKEQPKEKYEGIVNQE